MPSHSSFIYRATIKVIESDSVDVVDGCGMHMDVTFPAISYVIPRMVLKQS